MIPYHFQIYASVLFYLFCKILGSYVSRRDSMLDKGRQLMSTEKPFTEEETVCKWIPKKKHEVLKAKYKCLKKLFQIYDASVIGILPDPCAGPEVVEREERKHSRRRRSHRTKTDACSGTNEVPDDIAAAAEKRSIATAVIRDLKLNNKSESAIISEERIDKFTQDSRDRLSFTTSEKECECTETLEIPQASYLSVQKPRKKPTRFQIFLQRLLGIKREKPDHQLPIPHVYAASDNNDRYCNRRKRGLRFRRLCYPKKILSETALRGENCPAILSYVQSVQRNYLMDTTPRQCPFVGCRTIFYGIINYNDHLNVSHFTERKYFCHYCHESFIRECEKLVHENDHIGITKLNIDNNLSNTLSSDRPSFKVASLTQTEPQALDFDNEKLKKIVSFFDKIDDPEEILAELKKSRHSRSNLNLTRHSSKTDTIIPLRRSDRGENGAFSSACQLKPEARSRYAYSGVLSQRSSSSSLRCQICGDTFDRKQRLNLHVEMEHRGHKQKYASSLEHRRDRGQSQYFQHRNSSTVKQVDTSSTLSHSPSDESKSCDPSTNIVYYTSLDSIQKPYVMDYMEKHARGGFDYKWEPGIKSGHC